MTPAAAILGCDHGEPASAGCCGFRNEPADSRGGQEFEDQVADFLTEIRDDKTLHNDTVALLVSLDEQAPEPGWREVACGRWGAAQQQWDDAHTTLCCTTFRTGQDPFETPDQPGHGAWDAADGGAGHRADDCRHRRWAKDNGTFLERLAPDIRLMDVGHACPYLKAAAYGTKSARSTAWFKIYKAILTDDPHGGGKVIDALYSRRRKSLKVGATTTTMESFRSNRQRMPYKETRDAESPISSDAVEAVNKMIVKTRLKRWGRAGG